MAALGELSVAAALLESTAAMIARTIMAVSGIRKYGRYRVERRLTRFTGGW